MFFIDDVVDILFFICEDKEKLFMSYYKILINMIKCIVLIVFILIVVFFLILMM